MCVSSSSGSVANFMQEVPKGQLPLFVRGLGGQGGELFGWCQTLCPRLNHHLPFLEPMHELNPGEGTLRGVEGLEPQHGASDPLHAAMILFDDVVEILDLADFDRGAVLLIAAA